ncbi:MAG TPA: M81 family metallopeptidase [Usitatibacter sp.]|jgi:microcystin degradation protein MlrC|nr:M81 family metallopeptidase [Usitatibacter sp.]
MPAPRIAVGGFMLESNRRSPVATRAEFAQHFVAAGAALEADWKSAHPRSPVTLTGFVEAMNGSGPWKALPLVCATAGASGPVDHGFFLEVLEGHAQRLEEALPVEGVFLALHGAAIGTEEADPEGALLERVRKRVGPGVPILATLDLHANVSQRMVDNASVLVAYRTNPHVDMAQRGAECAGLLREMLAGVKATASFVKLPFIPPSVAQNTKSGPYADIIAYGQSKIDARVMNVSVVSGFSLGDTPKNGMSVIVTTRDDARLARVLARDIARKTWEDRERYVPRLTAIEDATRMALECGRDPSRPSLLFADVADNPGGGGRGNTVWILESFHKAGVHGCLLGPFYDPVLAAEAHAQGRKARFRARFNRDETQELSGRFEAEAEVVALNDGPIVGKRGISAGHTIETGRMALLQVDGIRVVVMSVRQQAKDIALFECFGIDLAATRSLVVKSRGHFRAAFDLLFPDERIIEVDAPGLTTPILSRVPYRHVPRPIFPLDPGMTWQP